MGQGAPPAGTPPAAPTLGSNRFARALLTGVAGSVQHLIVILIGLAATPVLIRHLGADQFGTFRAMEQWAGYLQFFGLGLGSALGVLLLRSRTSGEPESFPGLTRRALLMGTRQIPKILPLAALLAWVMPDLLHVRPELRGEVRLAAGVLLAGALLPSPLAVFRTVLDVSQAGYLATVALLAQSLTITGLGVWLAIRGHGILGLAIATAAGSVLYHLLLGRLGSSRVADLRGTTARAIPGAELWALRWPAVLAGVGNQINLMTDGIVTHRVISPAAVTSLLVSQRLIGFVGGYVTTLSSVSWAGLAELRARVGQAAFQDRVCELVRLLVGAGIALVGTVAAYNRHFVALWVGREQYGGDLLSAFTAAQAVIFAFLVFFTWYIDMHGDTRHRLWMSTAGSFVNLVASIVLARWIGLAGIPLGTVIGYLSTDAWFCAHLFCRRYGVSRAAVLRSICWGVSLGLPWVGAVWAFARRQAEIESWAGLVGELGLVSLVTVGYCWMLILTPGDRVIWRGRLGGLLNRRTAEVG